MARDPSQFGRGLRFGAGFAISWAVVFFVGIPLLFIGGCAILLGGATHSGEDAGASHARPGLTAADHRVLERRAMKDVRYYWSPPYRTVSARCSFASIDTTGPDSWNYRCLTTAAGKSGKRVTFREVIPCFDPPPYANADSCETSGQTPRRLRRTGA